MTDFKVYKLLLNLKCKKPQRFIIVGEPLKSIVPCNIIENDGKSKVSTVLNVQ